MQGPPPGGYPPGYRPPQPSYGQVPSDAYGQPYPQQQMMIVPVHQHMQQPGVFTCPFCRYAGAPLSRSKISTGGWVMFVVMLLFCFPLFWIGFLMKDYYRVCAGCGTTLGGAG